MTNYALDLQGSGAHNLYSVGPIKYLYEKKIPISQINGTSGGALCAILTAQGDLDLLEHLWLTITNKDVLNLNLFNIINGELSLYDSTPLLKTLQKYIKPERLAQCQIPTYITVTDLQTNTVVRVDVTKPNPNLAYMALASASIPGIFPRVFKRYVDGGVCDDYDIESSIINGADEVIFVQPSVLGPVSYKTWPDVLMAVLSAAGAYNLELQKQCAYLKNIPIRHIKPDGPQPWGVIDFNMKGIDRAAVIKQSYEDAKKVLG